MPLYISCVYINFMYFGTAAAWHLRLPALAEACVAGLLAELIYAPYDIVGNKFLWWTWHDTDSSIGELFSLSLSLSVSLSLSLSLALSLPLSPSLSC